tara:strand:+ start:146 stop:469 length:324 start_codon:yes stop_codon:yes gene_type:complete
MKETIIIDLTEVKKLNESAALIKFGAKLKRMLYYMFAPSGMSFAKFYLKGGRSDIKALVGVLASEKQYMDAFLKNGLNDPMVLNNRYRLERSIKHFESETGIKWPLK